MYVILAETFAFSISSLIYKLQTLLPFIKARCLSQQCLYKCGNKQKLVPSVIYVISFTPTSFLEKVKHYSSETEIGSEILLLLSTKLILTVVPILTLNECYVRTTSLHKLTNRNYKRTRKL